MVHILEGGDWGYERKDVQVPEQKDLETEDLSLSDSSIESLSQTFKQLMNRQRGDMAGFRPTLSDLTTLVSKFHDAGIDSVGVELMDFNSLREYNLLRKSPPETVGKTTDMNVLYCMLNIYDARFLVRVHPDHVIDCYLDNMNKPSQKIQYLDSDDFWLKKDGDKKVEHFFRCDLSEETGQVELMNTVLLTAAACAVAREMAEVCLPGKKEMGFSKPSGGFVIK